MAQRTLQQAPIAGGMAEFARGNTVADSTLAAIRKLVRDGEVVRWVPIRMRLDDWWSTRLFLTAALTDVLTPIRQIVFCHADKRFAGMATPRAVRAGLAASFPKLAEVDRALHTALDTRDVERGTEESLAIWESRVPHQEEQALKVTVRWQLVREWLGERLVCRCVRLDPGDGLTMFHVQQIVEALVPDVPVERPAPMSQATEPPDPVATPLPDPDPNPEAQPEPEIMVVDRDAFALELAREWVRSGLPRAPLA